MFGPLAVPFGAKMLLDTVKLEPGVSFDDVELAVGAMCNVVKETTVATRGGLRRAGVQVLRLRLARRIAGRGCAGRRASCDRHLLAFVRGARALARGRDLFRDRFSALADLCSDSQELGYEMLWQGGPETE
jgi:hypothetical protein